jgi:hypothetical protein
MMTIQFTRVRFLNGKSWLVELGRERKFLFLRWMSWLGFVTFDHGDSWAHALQRYSFVDPGFMLDPETGMREIDLCIAGLLPHLNAHGLSAQAGKLRERQEKYWEKQRARRMRLAAGVVDVVEVADGERERSAFHTAERG